jgi:hypothetical protein
MAALSRRARAVVATAAIRRAPGQYSRRGGRCDYLRHAKDRGTVNRRVSANRLGRAGDADRALGQALFVIDGPANQSPESPTRFFELVQEAEIEFVKGPDGAVSHMLLNGQQKAPRLSQPPAMAPRTM